ncbi:hypothetical protein HispidOSU_028583, partial [Sigmodon hispidus]
DLEEENYHENVPKGSKRKGGYDKARSLELSKEALWSWGFDQGHHQLQRLDMEHGL